MSTPGFPPPPVLDAGWYPDPTGRYEARFWDGRRWTAHVSHYGAVGTDPMRRARMESRVGAGAISLVKALFALGAIGVVAYAGWRLWPGNNRDTETDELTAAAIGVQLADVPEGWVDAEPRPLGLLSEVALPAECDELRGAVEKLRDEPLARQSVATTDSTREISSTVAIAADEGGAKDFLDALRSEQAPACLEAIFPRSLQSESEGATVGVEVADFVARELSPPPVGDEAVTWRLQGTTGGQIPVQLTVDLVVIRIGNRVAELGFRSILNEMEPPIQGAAQNAVASRLQTPPVVETPTDGTPTDGTPTDGTPTDGTPTDGTPTDGTPTDGTPTDGTPTDGTPTTDPGG